MTSSFIISAVTKFNYTIEKRSERDCRLQQSHFTLGGHNQQLASAPLLGATLYCLIKLQWNEADLREKRRREEHLTRHKLHLKQRTFMQMKAADTVDHHEDKDIIIEVDDWAKYTQLKLPLSPSFQPHCLNNSKVLWWWKEGRQRKLWINGGSSSRQSSIINRLEMRDKIYFPLFSHFSHFLQTDRQTLLTISTNISRRATWLIQCLCNGAFTVIDAAKDLAQV